MKKITILFSILAIAFNTVSAQTVFDFDTNATVAPDQSSITETIDGITVTITGSPGNWRLSGIGSVVGTTGDIASNAAAALNTVTFTFSEPVNVNSIYTIEPTAGSTLDFTFVPDGDASRSVTETLTGWGPVNLNWTNVTSFTVTNSAEDDPGGFGFDDLSVDHTLSVSNISERKLKVFPNPVRNSLYIKSVSNLKSIDIYNSLGQLVLQSKQDTIDVSLLSEGMYFLKIHTDAGVETKRIIKK